MTKLLVNLILVLVFSILLLLFLVVTNPKLYGTWKANVDLQYDSMVYINE